MSATLSTAREGSPEPLMTAAEQVRAAREIMRMEAVALWKVSNQLSETFADAVELIHTAKGNVIVTGMGKAGIIGQKIAATLASTGTRSHFLHPAEAFHGDLGRLHGDDVVLMLSQSGETSEVVQLLPCIRSLGAPIIGITASDHSTVGRNSKVVLELGRLEEACSLGLAPSTTTTAMLALGDALALVLSKLKGFGAEDFARYHPGGALGKQLSKVDDCMRPLEQCRVAPESNTVREVIVGCGKPGRRTGAVMLVGAAGKLTGIFTDSDLARLFEKRDERALDRPIADVMISGPMTVTHGARMSEAVRLLAKRKISELPVVDRDGRPMGMIDVTDLIGWSIPEEKPLGAVAKAASLRNMKIFPGEDVYAAG
jgi:arabinose-5-phosphate isomerase